jgi:O-antigen/teichoic acid export membrane protein
LREAFSDEFMRFSSQIVWTFATRLLMIFNSVVAGIIVAHWLGAEGVGQLAVVNVAVATIVQLGSFGLPSSSTYFIAQDQARFRAAALNSLVFALGVGSVAALALGVAASTRPDWFGLNSATLIHIAAFSIPFQLFTLIGLNILLAIGKIREFNLLELASQSFVLINAALVSQMIKGDLETLVLWNTITSVLVSIVIAAW